MTTNDYLDPLEQRARLEAIIARHRDSGGAIAASAVPALTTDLGELLDTARSSGTADGYEEAINQE